MLPSALWLTRSRFRALAGKPCIERRRRQSRLRTGQEHLARRVHSKDSGSPTGYQPDRLAASCRRSSGFAREHIDAALASNYNGLVARAPRGANELVESTENENPTTTILNEFCSFVTNKFFHHRKAEASSGFEYPQESDYLDYRLLANCPFDPTT
jgi:hypothetical protein